MTMTFMKISKISISLQFCQRFSLISRLIPSLIQGLNQLANGSWRVLS